jgi:hypothetical protein
MRFGLGENNCKRHGDLRLEGRESYHREQTENKSSASVRDSARRRLGSSPTAALPRGCRFESCWAHYYSELFSNEISNDTHVCLCESLSGWDRE